MCFVKTLHIMKSGDFLRIARFTLDGYFNYGNLLQNYALQYVLKKYADEIDSVWTMPNNFLPQSWWRWSWKEPIKWFINWKGFRDNFKIGRFGIEMARQARMRDFADRYINYRYDADLTSLDAEYDYFVVGSDQVWNPNWDFKNYFLPFASPEKRISYAASISSPDVPDAVKVDYIKGLNGMKTLSLREQAGADLVEKLTGRKAMVHVDPTLLLTADEWRKVSRQPTWYHGEDYVLTYFLGKRPAAVDEIIKSTGLKVVNLLDENVYEHYVTGVDEFIWAIEHAKLVYTDSFHGTVFSIIFRRPFVVCDRVGNSIETKMTSRIDSLLQLFGLEARRGTIENNYSIEEPLTMNYPDLEPVFTRERKRSFDYLASVLFK